MKIEIKYRVWDGETMHQVTEIDWPIAPDYRGCVRWADFGEVPFDGAVLMQYII